MKKIISVILLMVLFAFTFSCTESQTESNERDVYHKLQYSPYYGDSLYEYNFEEFIYAVKENKILSENTVMIMPSNIVLDLLHEPVFSLHIDKNTSLFQAIFSVNDPSLSQRVDSGQYGTVAHNFTFTIVINTAVEVDINNITFEELNKDDCSNVRGFNIFSGEYCFASMYVYNKTGISSNVIDGKIERYVINNLSTVGLFVDLYEAEKFEIGSETNSNYKKDDDTSTYETLFERLNDRYKEFHPNSLSGEEVENDYDDYLLWVEEFTATNEKNFSDEFKGFIVLNPNKVDYMQGRSNFYLLYSNYTKEEPFIYESLSLFDSDLYGKKTDVTSYNFKINITIMPILEKGVNIENIRFEYVNDYLVDIYYNNVCFASASFGFNEDTLKNVSYAEQKNYFERYVKDNLFTV